MLSWLRELPCPPTSREPPSCGDNSVLSSALCHRAIVSQEHCAQPVSAYSQAEARTVVTGGTFEEVTGWTSVSRGCTSRDGLPPTRGCHPVRPPKGASWCLSVVGTMTSDRLVRIDTACDRQTDGRTELLCL